MKFFFDTNVLVYLFDADSPDKRKKARTLFHRSRSDQLSFWDALIGQAAIEGHASTLYSEDMQHGQMFNSLRVVNPFS
jgi:predicted nucleic acid-binding protein